MKSAWQTVKSFFNNNLGRSVTRKRYFQTLEGIAAESLLDTYRCYLMNAGYINREAPGVYYVCKMAPPALTTREVLRQGRGRRP